MSQDVQNMLEPHEQIVWQGVVSRTVLTAYALFTLLVIGVVAALFNAQEVIHYTSNEVAKQTSGSKVALIVLSIGVIVVALYYFSNLVHEYAITNKRVLLKSGLIGTDYNSVYFTQIRTVNVNVGLIDKLFSTGTINIDTGKIQSVTTGTGNHQRERVQTAYDKLLHISQPYEVYKQLQNTLSGREESLYSGRADREHQNI